MRIEHRKIRHDDGDGKRDRQHSGQRAQRAHEHTHIGLRGHVAVSNRSHGHDGPPQAFRNTFEVILRVGLEEQRQLLLNDTSARGTKLGTPCLTIIVNFILEIIFYDVNSLRPKRGQNFRGDNLKLSKCVEPVNIGRNPETVVNVGDEKNVLCSYLCD